MSQKKAGSIFSDVSRQALQRIFTTPKYTSVIKDITEIELPARLDGFEFDIMARSLYALLPQLGGQTHLTPAEEIALVKNAVELSEKGFSITHRLVQGDPACHQPGQLRLLL